MRQAVSQLMMLLLLYAVGFASLAFESKRRMRWAAIFLAALVTVFLLAGVGDSRYIRVVRAGKVVARIQYFRAGGGWLEGEYSACKGF